MKKRVNLSKKIWEFASTWVDVVDALAAHEWGENGQRRPVSKVANKVEPFFFLFFLLFFLNNEPRFFSFFETQSGYVSKVADKVASYFFFSLLCK